MPSFGEAFIFLRTYWLVSFREGGGCMDTDPGSKQCLEISRPLASVFREEGYYAKSDA